MAEVTRTRSFEAFGAMAVAVLAALVAVADRQMRGSSWHCAEPTARRPPSPRPASAPPPAIVLRSVLGFPLPTRCRNHGNGATDDYDQHGQPRLQHQTSGLPGKRLTGTSRACEQRARLPTRAPFEPPESHHSSPSSSSGFIAHKKLKRRHRQELSTFKMWTFSAGIRLKDLLPGEGL